MSELLMPNFTAPLHKRAQAMILAAGRGERMRPLTDVLPKPLLKVKGKPLMQYPLEALTSQGFSPVLSNTAWLGDKIEAHYGDRLLYSREAEDFGAALETAGGIVRALPQLAEIFWLVAGDVYAPDFLFDPQAIASFKASDRLAHLWLVPNPPHNPKGDFGLAACREGEVMALAVDGEGVDGQRWTYSTIGLFRHALFESPYCDIPVGNPMGVNAPLAPLLRKAMAHGRVSAQVYTGAWTDVGTPERLAQLNAE